MSNDSIDDFDFLDELQGLTEGSEQSNSKHRKQADFHSEKLEERVLFSATWVDADTGEELSNSTADDDVFTGTDGNDQAYGRGGDDILEGLDGNDRLYGQDGDDQIDGGDGNDDLRGDFGDDVIEGGDGNDRIIGGAGVDELSGGDGNDLIYADAEDSVIDGGAGQDRVIVQGGGDFQIDMNATSIERVDGGSGNDVIDGSGMTERAVQVGNAGNDTLLSGGGDDYLDGGVGDDVVAGGSGNDRIKGGEGADQLSGGDGNDLIYADSEDTLVSGGDGYDRVIVQDAGDFSLDQSEAGVEYVSSGSGDDSLDASGMTERVHQFGNVGDDVLVGGSGNDVQYGGVGNDQISGGDGNDTIRGNEGSDQLRGGDGNDLIYADADDSLIDGGDGTDRVIVQGSGDFTIDQLATSVERVTGGVGNDTMDATGVTERVTQSGNLGDDVLIGGSNHDYQYGGDGNDTIFGGDGNDRIYGNDGADRLSGEGGNDTIFADEHDVVHFSGDYDDYEVTDRGNGRFTVRDLRDGSPDGYDTLLNATTIQFADGVATIDGGEIEFESGETATIEDSPEIEPNEINGSDNNDNLRGTDTVDSISGGDGNDTLRGNEGADELRGGDGNDRIYADSEDSVIDGGDGYDHLSVANGNDFNLDQAESSIERVTGGHGNDTFDATDMDVAVTQSGGYGNDNLLGGSGNDIQYGGGGNDVISGGDGNDRLYGQSGADELRGGEGDDIIYADGQDTVVDGGEGSDRVIVQGGIDFEIDQSASSVERVDGGFGNDSLDASGMTDRVTQLGNAGDDTLVGGSGNDSQHGGDGNDTIEGGDGNDTIRGNYGTDVLSGGAGNDNISGGIGADQLRGGAGNDIIYADSTDTVIDGGSGVDRVIVEGGEDFSIDQAAASVERVDGGSANDTLNAAGMVDRATQYGNGGDDVLTGGSGNDYQRGGDGNDTIIGGDGNDRIFGDDGDDIIEGGAGDDLIYGNAGEDTVRFDGNWSDYEVTYRNGRVTVQDLRDGAPDGRDVIYQVENLVFADGAATVSDGVDFAHDAMDFSGGTVTENAAAGTYVGEFSVDPNQPFEYEIVDENGNIDANSNFKVVGNQIVVNENADINFEEGNVVEFLVRSTAEDGDQYTETLELQVTDVNEGPVANNDTRLTSFKLVEKFDDGNFDDWEPISLGNDTYNWSVNSDGEAAEQSNSGKGFLGYDVSQSNTVAANATEYQITVDVDANTGNTYNNGVGMVFGYEDNQNYYQVSWDNYSENYSNSSAHKDFTLFKVENGVRTELDKIDAAELPDQFELSLSVSADGIQVEVDGSAMLDATAETPPVKTFGLYTFDNDRGVSYDNVQLEVSSPLQTNEDTSLSFDSAMLLANDVDEDGDAMSIKSVQDAKHGTVTLNDDGSITFEPQENYNGPATFSYTVETADGMESTATVTIDVLAQNDAVTDIEFSGTVTENAIAGTVVGALNATDVDTDESHTFEFVDESGVVVDDANFEIVGNEVRVKSGADINFEAQDSIELNVRATDSAGSQYTETIAIDVTDVNEGQIGSGEAFEVSEDGSVSGNLLANDVDIDGDVLSVASFEQPENGTVVVDENGDFVYEPNTNFSGSDSFEYTIADGNGESTTQTVELQVNAAVDSAQVDVDNASGNEDEAIALEIQASLVDTDGSERIAQVTVSNVPEGAQLSAGTDNGDGSWSIHPKELEDLTITPPENFHGEFELSIDVTTEEGVTQIDFSSDVQSHGGSQDRNGDFDVQENGDVLLISENGWKSVPGEFVITDNTVIEFEYKSTEMPELAVVGFDNDARWNNGPRNSDFFNVFGHQSHGDAADNAYRIYDGSGEYQTIRIPVGQHMSGEFDRMTFLNDDDQANSAGVEGNSYFRNVRIFEDGETSTATISQTLTVQVAAVNDAVTDVALSNTTVVENASPGTVVGTLSASDVDSGERFVYEFVDDEGNAVEDANFEVVDGEVRVKLGANLNFEISESHTLNIRVTDSGGAEHTEQFTIDVQDINEGQIAKGKSFAISEDGNVSGNLLANDVDLDGDSLAIESYDQPGNGTVSVNANGDFVYQPNANFSGTDRFEYTVTDGNGATSTQTVTINVTAVADAATLSTLNVSGNEDTAIELSISADLVDVDGSETISDITINNVPAGAVLSAGTDNGDGSWSLEASDLDGLSVTPAENSHDDFELQVAVTTTDGVSTQTVHSSFDVEVSAVNDVVTDLALSNASVEENAVGGTIVGALSATDVDDGESFTFDLVDADGNIVDDSNFEVVDNQVRVKLGADLNFEAAQSHTINVRVTDSGGLTRIESFDIEVQNVNEGQVTAGESFTIGEDGSVTGNLLSNDFDLDGDQLSVENFEQPENGKVSVDDNGNFVYQPNENFSGSDSFEYTVTDGNGETSIQTVTVQVDAIADAAQIEVTDASGNEDQAIDLNIETALVDVDGSERISQIRVLGVPDFAQLTAGVNNGDGSWTLEEEQLDGLQLKLEGFGNDDFDLNVEVTTVDGNDSTATHANTIKVELEHDTLNSTLSQQPESDSDSQAESEDDNFNNQYVLDRVIANVDSLEDFEAAYNEIQALNQEISELNSGSDWENPEFESFQNQLEYETNERQELESEPALEDSAENLVVESYEVPEREDLERDTLEEFDFDELSELPIEISGLGDLAESRETSNLTAASLLLMVTTREDSRQKLLNVGKGKRKNTDKN